MNFCIGFYGLYRNPKEVSEVYGEENNKRQIDFVLYADEIIL